MNEIKKFLEIKNAKGAAAYVKGLKDPSPEFQMFLFLYLFSGGSDYAEDLQKISARTLEWLKDCCEDDIYIHNSIIDDDSIYKKIDKTAEAYVKYIDLIKSMGLDDNLELNLDGLSSPDTIKVIVYIHKYDVIWYDELKWVAKQPEKFQIEYVKKSKKFLNDKIIDFAYDGSFKPAANKLLIESLSPQTLLSIVTSDEPNYKFKIPAPFYEKAVLDLIKSNAKWSLSISGSSAYSAAVVEFHKKPGIGLLNTAILRILSDSEKKEFLKTKPSFSQSQKIKHANRVYINLNWKDVSIPLVNKKLIDVALMTKTLEM